MTPEKLDDELIQSKLKMMQRLLRQLNSMGVFDRERLRQNLADQLIAERVLSALVDLASAVNTHVAVALLEEAPHDLKASSGWPRRPA